MEHTNKIACVVGPTACGKTTLGILLAQRFGGEIVSADSMQIYRGMAIGTAAPTAEEMALAPHHMVGVADPQETYSAARFVEDASACVDDILARGKLPIVVGGTGLYLDALVAGRSFAAGGSETRSRQRLNERLAREGIEPLYRELSIIDPTAAARLHLRDEKRILRALEIYYETGQTITEHDAQSKLLPPRYDAVYIGLTFEDRADLRALIDARVDAMLSQGLVEEVRALLSAGVSPSSTALQAIGYKELLGALRGEKSLTEEIKLRSRQYAKRQLTWLRRNKAIHWIFWKKERDFPRALQLSTEILSAHGLG